MEKQPVTPHEFVRLATIVKVAEKLAYHIEQTRASLERSPVVAGPDSAMDRRNVNINKYLLYVGELAYLVRCHCMGIFDNYPIRLGEGTPAGWLLRTAVLECEPRHEELVETTTEAFWQVVFAGIGQRIGEAKELRYDRTGSSSFSMDAFTATRSDLKAPLSCVLELGELADDDRFKLFKLATDEEIQAFLKADSLRIECLLLSYTQAMADVMADNPKLIYTAFGGQVALINRAQYDMLMEKAQAGEQPLGMGSYYRETIVDSEPVSQANKPLSSTEAYNVLYGGADAEFAEDMRGIKLGLLAQEDRLMNQKKDEDK